MSIIDCKRRAIITCTVEADDEAMDKEIVDLAVRLGKAMLRRNLTCMCSVEWEAKPEPEAVKDEPKKQPDKAAN